MKKLTVLMLCACLAGVVCAGTSDKEVLLKLQHQWCQADMAGNAASLSEILADSFTRTTSGGIVLTKKAYLKRVRTKKPGLMSLTPKEIKIQLYGDMAVVKGLMSLTFGEGEETRFLYTDTWMKRDGQWKCLATHESNVKKTNDRASEQAAPNSILKRMAGNWTWTGTQVDVDAEDLPFGQGGQFSGSSKNRLVLNGQFLMSEWKETSPEGHVLHGINLTSYDNATRTYVAYSAMSDGSTTTNTFTVKGRVGKSQSTITTQAGNKILTKTIRNYSPDWNKQEIRQEISVDNGKTWTYWAEGTITKSDTPLRRQVRVKPTTREDFNDFSRLAEGRWVAEVTLDEDVSGIGKKGDTIEAFMDHSIVSNGNATIGRNSFGKGWVTELKTYDPHKKEIVTIQARADGAMGYIQERKNKDKWDIVFTRIAADGTKSESIGTTVFSEDGKTWTIRSGSAGQEKDEWSTTVYHRLSD